MAMLDVIYNQQDFEYLVINNVDGRLIGRFYARTDAEDFAFEEEANEQHRIKRKYDQ